MTSHEKTPVDAETHTDSFVPSRGYLLGIHIFEISSTLAVIICLSIAAVAHHKLYDEGINYDSSRFRASGTNDTISQHQTGYDQISGVPHWMILGLVVSCVGFFFSVLFCFDRGFNFPLLQGFIGLILFIGFIIYVVFGALNTPYQYQCYGLADGIASSDPGYSAIITAQRNRCAAPKAAEFFSFVATFSYSFTANAGLKVGFKSRKYSGTTVV